MADCVWRCHRLCMHGAFIVPGGLQRPLNYHANLQCSCRTCCFTGRPAPAKHPRRWQSPASSTGEQQWLQPDRISSGVMSVAQNLLQGRLHGTGLGTMSFACMQARANEGEGHGAQRL